MALAAGATADEIQLGLKTAVIEPGRMTQRLLGSCLLVDDTYNASPHSTRAAIDWLSEQGGTKILAVGGLSELGDAAYSEMTQVGAYAKAKGIDRLIATGLADPIADGFGQDAIYVSRMTRSAIIYEASFPMLMSFLSKVRDQLRWIVSLMRLCRSRGY